ncbi:MAG: protoheme IX farnesyltransferase [Acidobacteria bacterium]|nr:protoheme IX farnesyltransferase [Acidobacteriota bacterium]
MSLVKDYVALTKPRITWLILMSTAVGFYFGKPMLKSADLPWVLFHLMLGTGLIASGTAALNQWWERDSDRYMSRTAGRPLPTGKVGAMPALVFGVVLAALGFVELWLGCNLLTAGLGLFTLTSYLFLYTPMKRMSPHSTTVGAIPGAMPPLLGYAAATNALTLEAWALYAILFVWQFPHFYAIAWMYREEYGKAGIRMLPVVEPDGESTASRILWTSVLMVPTSLLPIALAMSGKVYLAASLIMGALLLYCAFKMFRQRSRENARGVLLATVVYLPVLYAVLIFAPR